ncbi:hypothetical protein QJS10_CPA06g01927 [Acorus calamus]|uniref:Pre-rRNA-processing protein TSR2 homolog n=1 Tax=Acorus calamus TaxID=4465 RepID=A0AAV9EPM6_ACOCL|nr:hypothetical protein QJS10_CPA06g01927 [Acorus calamus]
MDSGGCPPPEPPPTLSAEATSAFAEGISLVLSRWTALQMAVDGGWAGNDSRQKSDQFAPFILSWFVQSKAPLYIDELEETLDDYLLSSFNTEADDGSVEEVAEQLMIMHEDCLQGNYEAIENLRRTNAGKNSVLQSRQVPNDDESGDESLDDEEEAMDMAVDEPSPKPDAMDKQRPKQSIDEDGWSVVGPRRGRGRKSN